jgi:SAM-dependent methyltransferase
LSFEEIANRPDGKLLEMFNAAATTDGRGVLHMRSLMSALRVRALVRQRILGHSTQQIFSRMYHRNSWANPESVSGDGSDLNQTQIVRRELATLIRQRTIETLLDAPCGDYYWMKTLDAKLARYIGADIVPELVKENQRAYGGPTASFVNLDICRDELPKVDLILCRDCLVHLPLDAAVDALRNFKKSGSKFLLTTTYPGVVRRNKHLFIIGNWRPLDMTLAPFSLPEPVQIIKEECTETDDYKEKSLGLWDLAQVQI